MRYFAILLIGAFASAQTMTEFGAAAAGGTAGSAAGKKVSDGITNIFGNVSQHTAAAASAPGKSKSAAAPAPVIEVGPGTEAGGQARPASSAPAVTAKAKKPAPKPAPKKEVDHSLVPPPPPVTASVQKKPAPEPIVHQLLPSAPVEPPPPPTVTADDLRTVRAGESREDLLKLGSPASQITMYEDGHLLEIYSYRAKETLLGRVRLHDGAVDSVEIR